MMRPGHASTMTLGIYNTPFTSSLPASDSQAYTCDPPTNPSQYLTIYLSNDDPTDALFTTDSGQMLYQSRTAPLPVHRGVYPPIQPNRQQSKNTFRGAGTVPPISPRSPSSISTSSSGSYTQYTPLVTRVSRLYGSTARALREAALKRGDRRSAEEGLLVAELEWLSRTQSSRIRFGDGLAVNKQNAVDVRVDEFLKSTNGRGFSKMFATPDGRIYKWKTDTNYSEPAHLVECDSGKRVSGPLVTFHRGAGQDRGARGSAVEMERRDDAGVFGERVLEGGMPPSSLSSLRVATQLLPVIDQILVSWVIMEKERRSMVMASLASPSSSSYSPSLPSPSFSAFSSSSSSSGSSGSSSPGYSSPSF